MNLVKYRKQAGAENDLIIQTAPFFMRRPFYLGGKLCYKGMRCD